MLTVWLQDRSFSRYNFSSEIGKIRAVHSEDTPLSAQSRRDRSQRLSLGSEFQRHQNSAEFSKSTVACQDLVQEYISCTTFSFIAAFSDCCLIIGNEVIAPYFMSQEAVAMETSSCIVIAWPYLDDTSFVIS